MSVDFDGLTPFEATAEFAEATKALVGLLYDGGTIPKEGIPGWVAGVVVTSLVEAIRERDGD